MASLVFPPKTVELLKRLDLREDDVIDVYHSGEYQKTRSGGHSVVKKYKSYSYEIGLLYMIDDITGKHIITFVWKRERR